ncbi:MAG: hypothetical protein KF902_01800 [Phycisphaeraceae bacterium]|nr:hypothetical protein [Phycisphaeraceae bacterium]
MHGTKIGRANADPVTPTTRLVFSLAAGAMLTCASPALAQVGNIGYQDWRRNYRAGWTVQFIETGIVGSHWHLQDNAIIAPGGGGATGRDFDGAGIAFFTTGANGIPSDLVQVTTVYGIDLTPNDALPMVNGLDINNPVFEFVSVETIIGRSGAAFESGPVQTILLSEVGSLVPDMNLSWFASGDPNSHLYYFQTIAPLSEFYIPTPGALTLLGLGGLLAARRRR